MNKWALLSMVSVTLVVGTMGYKMLSGDTVFAVDSGVEKSDEKGPYKEFVFEAKENRWLLKPGLEVLAWTYNGTVPGPQIRVKEGERVKVTLKNTLLPDPVTIHWHGYPVPNPMDGVAGVTQNGVMPGETFTYDFVAKVPGTYWYHSHQDGVNQVDRGLYGTLIVEPKEEKVHYDRDYTLVLDEWAPDMIGQDHSHIITTPNGTTTMSGAQMGGMNMSGMNMGGSGSSGNANMSGMNMMGMSPEEHAKMMADMGMDHTAMMKQMYNVFTVNGKSGDLIDPLQVKQGEKVRLRFVNAGNMMHYIHLQDMPFRIIASDGQDIADGPTLENRALPIAPGERYDLEFTADGKGNFMIDFHDDAPGAKGFQLPVVYEDGNQEPVNHEDTENLPGLSVVDITKYITAKPVPNPQLATFDVTQTFVLGSTVVETNGVQEQMYTLNGKIYPNTDPIHVKKGQTVKLILDNPDVNVHPIHLHGHFFQVLSRNGEPLGGAPLMKDTININPGEKYEIGFVADNDGIWMMHCHDLHHASAGMMTHMMYEGYQMNFTPDPNIPNKPE